MKMRVLRHLRYPRGPNAKAYNKGDEIDTLTEKDAKALRLMRIAEPIKSKPMAKPASVTQERSQFYQTTAETAEEGSYRRRYQRRDMQAED